MVEVDKAAVTWDAQKKRWVIRLQVGAEVIKRPALKTAHNADDDLLRTVAVKIAQHPGAVASIRSLQRKYLGLWAGEPSARGLPQE